MITEARLDIADPLAGALHAVGVPVTDRRLSGGASSLCVGRHVRLPDSEVVYRRPDDAPCWLLIALYRRLAERAPTLRNPFADLFWFFRLCTRETFGLTHVLCNISTVRYRDYGGLDDARMICFCERILNADWTRYDGHPWLCCEVESLRARLTSLRRRFPDSIHRETPNAIHRL